MSADPSPEQQSIHDKIPSAKEILSLEIPLQQLIHLLTTDKIPADTVEQVATSELESKPKTLALYFQEDPTSIKEKLASVPDWDALDFNVLSDSDNQDLTEEDTNAKSVLTKEELKNLLVNGQAVSEDANPPIFSKQELVVLAADNVALSPEEEALLREKKDSDGKELQRQDSGGKEQQEPQEQDSGGKEFGPEPKKPRVDEEDN